MKKILFQDCKNQCVFHEGSYKVDYGKITIVECNMKSYDGKVEVNSHGFVDCPKGKPVYVNPEQSKTNESKEVDYEFAKGKKVKVEDCEKKCNQYVETCSDWQYPSDRFVRCKDKGNLVDTTIRNEDEAVETVECPMGGITNFSEETKAGKRRNTMEQKTLNNSTIKQAKDQISDLEVVGNGDMFQLLCKASSKKEGWMKSTKAMVIPGKGCVVQVTTQQGENVAEALCYISDSVTIHIDVNNGRKLI